MLKKNVLIRKLILYTHTTHTYQIFFKFRNRAKIYDVQSCFLSSVQYFTIYICSTFFIFEKRLMIKRGRVQESEIQFFNLNSQRMFYLSCVKNVDMILATVYVSVFTNDKTYFYCISFFSSPSPLSTFIFKILWKNFNFNEND